MAVSPERVRLLRVEHGWSQEQLGEIAGVSYRTVQRIEKDGACSLDSQMALASAFDVSPNALLDRERVSGKGGLNYSGCAGLILCIGLLLFHIYVATDEHYSFFFNLPGILFVVGVTAALSFVSNGIGNTFKTLALLTWLVKEPSESENMQFVLPVLRRLIFYAYASALVSIVVGMIAILIQHDIQPQYFGVYIAIESLTLVYALILAELIFRPLKHKIDSMLLSLEDKTRPLYSR